MCTNGQMTDQELKEWQQIQIHKSRIENIFNNFTEAYRYLEVLQAGENPPQQFNIELEESAILMAIGAYGLVGMNSFRGAENISNLSNITNSVQNSILTHTENFVASMQNHRHRNSQQQQQQQNQQSLHQQQQPYYRLSTNSSRNFSDRNRSALNYIVGSSSSASSTAFNSNTVNNNGEKDSLTAGYNFDDHQQFVESAVSAAIQKQGLGIKKEPKR